jgi:tetratricopeptide (TPR) repeat protein
MRILSLILLLLTGFRNSTFADPSDGYFFHPTPDCSAAYDAYLSLRFPEGAAAVRRAIVAEPGNLLPVFLADYEDCLLLMLNGDPREYAQRKSHYDERIAWMEKGPEDAPWQRFTVGVLHLHWALVHVRFGERLKAGLAFRKSYLQLKENSKKFPSFAPNQLFLGFEEAIAGTIPDDYRWIASMLGVKGSTVKGVGAIGRFLDQTKNTQALFWQESALFYQYLRFYLLHQQEAAWQAVSSPAFDPSDNLLNSLVAANMALNYRHADAALQYLRAAQRFPESRRFPVVDYELGYAYLFRLDPAGIGAFEKYLATAPGSWYRKDAVQKIAWLYLLQGRADKAAEKLRAVTKTGNTFVDADKQAQRAATAGALPEPSLLAARLLCDGGFYQQALQKLTAIAPAVLNVPAYKLEYYYRAGRTYEGLSQTSKAVSYYNAAYEAGKDSEEQFGARAALQTAVLYERSGQAAAAKGWFRKTLALRKHDFQASIDQQAKAGLDRLGN